MKPLPATLGFLDASPAVATEVGSVPTAPAAVPGGLPLIGVALLGVVLTLVVVVLVVALWKRRSPRDAEGPPGPARDHPGPVSDLAPDAAGEAYSVNVAFTPGAADCFTASNAESTGPPDPGGLPDFPPEGGPGAGIYWAAQSDPVAKEALGWKLREAGEVPVGTDPLAAFAHVKVDVRGGCHLNGNPASLEGLRKEFARLRRVGGAVIYFREDPEKDGPGVVVDVVNAIADAGLPVTFTLLDYDPHRPLSEYLMRLEL